MRQEKWVQGVPKLYPTVRLQIIRDLYIREWQVPSPPANLPCVVCVCVCA